MMRQKFAKNIKLSKVMSKEWVIYILLLSGLYLAGWYFSKEPMVTTNPPTTYESQESKFVELIPEPSIETDVSPLVTIDVPPDGFKYQCDNKYVNLVRESILDYQRGINDQNACKNILNTTMSNRTAECNKIWDTCQIEILWKTEGYNSKNECVDVKSTKYSDCRNDGTNYMVEELKRCDQFWLTAKNEMNIRLKKYCEISVEE